MFLKILKRDLKRNKTMNIILFFFISLATIFVASGLNNLFSVLNGTDYYFDKAGIGNYMVIASSVTDDEEFTDILDSASSVKSYRKDIMMLLNVNAIRDKEGNKYSDNMTIIQSIDRSAIKFFDRNNEVIKNVDKGHVYVGGNFLENHHIKNGDTLVISFMGREKEFIVVDKCKDAFLGSDFMGNSRMVVNDEDFEFFYSGGDEEYNLSKGAIYYIDSLNVADTKSVISGVKDINIHFSESRSVIKLAYVMEMIVAVITFILSICLIILSFVMLRFSIGFTIGEDFREIGVMKAIGISDKKIRRLYTVKYNGIALVSVLIGLALSYPVAAILMKNIINNMVLETSWGFLLNVAGALAVFLVVITFAYICTGRLKKMSPTDAIRNGENGERFVKKGGIRITKAHMSNPLYLAVNDILSSPKRFLNIVISTLICSLFLLVVANTTATLDSDSCIELLANKADLYMGTAELGGSAGSGLNVDFENLFEEVSGKLEENGMSVRLGLDIWYKCSFTYNGKEYQYTFQKGMYEDDADDLGPVTSGCYPKNPNEIAVTEQISKETGLKIGDIIEINFGDRKEKFTVCGTIQTFNNLGSVIRIYSKTDMGDVSVSGFNHLGVSFNDNPDQKEIDRRRDEIKEIFGIDEVYNAREFCVDSMHALDMVSAAEKMLALVTIVVVILVTVLMERTFITDEKKQIAILKAIGFRNTDVILSQVLLFGILSLVSVIIAAILAVPVTNLCITPIFGMMGATDIDFVYSIKSLIKYLALIMGVSIGISFVTSLYSNKVKARDTASIE